LVAVVLGAQDLVGILDATAHQPCRDSVGQEARVERQIDGEGQGVGNRR
jgi:hypothetical protein